MAKNFGNNERFLIDLFRESKNFLYQDTEFFIEKIGKPRPAKGECKTDIYILAKSKKEIKEFKISVKQHNADFLENKISLDRAKEIFGNDAQKIITESILTIENKFTEEILVFFDRKNKTEAKCITLGWKFELFNKLCGIKSGEVVLNSEQLLEVYSGVNARDEKRNCNVNNEFIIDSGVANFVLEMDFTEKHDANYYFSKIIPVENYIIDKKIYFACKALNYRVEKDKWDGDRPLAVYVNWTKMNNKLNGEIVFECPLEVKGNKIGSKVRGILKELKINKNNFDKLDNFLVPTVKYFKEKQNGNDE